MPLWALFAYRQDTPWALCVDDKRLQSTLVYHYRNTLYSNPGICSQYTVIQVTVTQVLLERQCWHCMSAVNMHTAGVRTAHVYHRRLQWIRALGPISVGALSITAVYLGDLQRRAGMAVVGSITAGLPHLTVSWWLPMDHFWQLASTAVVISFVSLLESISIARALAEPRQQGAHPLNPNQELLGGCFPCRL